MNRKKTLLICLAILLAGSVITALIFSTEPTATRAGATQETAMLVDVTEVQRGTFHPTIRATGTVEASQDIMLSPRVSGEIIERSQTFTPGGYVQKGQILLQIDPADYKNNLQQRESELRQARSDFNIEMGQQRAAQKEYQLFGDTLSEENEELILRVPQLEAAKSRVQSAQAAVEQAELELNRTTIRAPFDAHILSRNVNIGSQVAAGENLGRLVGLDTYWVEVNLPLSKIRWLTFTDEDQEKSSDVKIRNRTAWEEDEYRAGHLYKLVGTLENQTRMAQILVEVPDPLAQEANNEGLPPLMIGSFVEASIQGRELSDVIRINRDYIRDGETVWVMEEGQLRIREVDIVFSDAEYAYIGSGLDEQDHVVTTNLSTVTDGAPLRLQESELDTLTKPIQ